MNPALPDPWLFVRILTSEEQDALEVVAGARIGYEDLGPEDVEVRGQATLPKSRRSMWVMGHRWVEIKDVDSDLNIYVRLQDSLTPGEPVRMSAIVFPFAETHDLTGADLRAVPVAALNAAFNRHELEGRMSLGITIALGDETPPPPLEPLPPANASARFAALVARQYSEIERSGGEAVAKRLAALNSVPLSTAQRWIARARRQGFLPPASPGERRNG